MPRYVGPPRESWLRSNNPYKFADAMVLCQNAAGTCASDGFCRFGGCFTVEALTAELVVLEDRCQRLRNRIAQLTKND